MKRISRVTAGCLLAIMAVLLAFTAYGLLEAPVWPEGGTNVLTDGMLTVDISHSDSGYVIISSEPSDKRIRVRVSYRKNQLYYDLDGDGTAIVVPLQFGSGKYEVELFQNTSGKKYAAEGSAEFEAELEDESVAYLVPNQYVDYDADTEAVAISNEICAGLTTDQEKYDAIHDYIVSNYAYDFARAATISSGTLPDIDYCTTNKMGICQDLAATMACMLRVQGVPCKLVVGYIGKYYHAWCGVYIDGVETQSDPTVELGGAPTNMSYSIERWY